MPLNPFLRTSIRSLCFFFSPCFNVFDKYKDKKLYRLHYDYFIQLDPILKEIFALYPQQMSEEFLLIVGKNLFSIFNFYSLDYSTNDLSDTFVFKFVKNSGLSKTEL